MFRDGFKALVARCLSDRVLLALVALHLVQFVLLFFVPGGRIADEELHSPTVAALLAAGHPFELPRLQYTPFCGGCTAETLLVLPLFALLGPSLAIWRLVPLAFGLALLVLSYRIVRRAEGPRAAAITGLCLVLAPPFFRECGIVAFGSHFEVLALVLAAMLPWSRLFDGGGRRDAFTLGILLGLAFWFSYTSAFAAPVLLGSLLLCQWRRLARREGLPILGALGLGGLLGIIPLVVTQLALRRAHLVADESLLSVYGRDVFDLVTGSPGLAARVMTLVGPSYWASTFNPTFGPDNVAPSLVHALLQAAFVGLALVLGWRSFRTNSGQPSAPGQGTFATGSAPFLLVAALLSLCYALLFVLMAPYRGEVPPPAPVPANGLRYLVPLVPLVALCAGPLLARGLVAGTRLRLASLAALLAFLLPGAIAAVDSVEVRWLSLEPLYRPAVDSTTVLGRTRWNAPSPSQLAAAGRIESPLADGSRHRFARRAHLHAYGEALAQRIEPNASSEVLQGVLVAIDQLPAGESLVVYQALIRSLSPAVPDPPWAAPSGPYAQLVSAAVQFDNGKAEQRLWRAALNRGRDTFWDLHLSLTQGKPLPANWLDPRTGEVRTEAFCWTIGAMTGVAFRQAQDPEFEMTEALRIRQLIPQQYRVVFAQGLGQSLGQRWGYSDRHAEHLALRLEDQAERNAFREAFEQGAEGTFLHPVGSR